MLKRTVSEQTKTTENTMTLNTHLNHYGSQHNP